MSDAATKASNGTIVETIEQRRARESADAIVAKAQRLLNTGHSPANVYRGLLLTAARLADVATLTHDRFCADAVDASLLVRGTDPEKREIGALEARLIAAKVRGEG